VDYSAAILFLYFYKIKILNLELKTVTTDQCLGRQKLPPAAKVNGTTNVMKRRHEKY
jgi:hypothetical protein